MSGAEKEQGGQASGATREPWHLDKRIPLALIGAILAQTAIAAAWVSSTNERITALEQWRTDNKEVAADIAVIKSQITDIKDTLERIDARSAGQKR